jgi:hypothetical protein
MDPEGLGAVEFEKLREERQRREGVESCEESVSEEARGDFQAAPKHEEKGEPVSGHQRDEQDMEVVCFEGDGLNAWVKGFEPQNGHA